ncbi:endo-arabinase [Maribacter aquivivus]|uniref:endo-arabinase n=1 Tax=Maribacter aquivivus TaxID=228958 RepID=UPI00249331E4|nr:endo-arabinase [Maribacter aquivivus]
MKYVFLVLLFSMTFSYAQTDEEAIISLLERESSSWRSGDVEAHASCWSIQPYSRIFVSMADGNSMDVPPAMMINPPEHLVGKGGTSKNSNYKMNVIGNNAWVTHDEESTTTDGLTNYTYEMRILEKIDGNWKLVGQSIHPRKME